MAASSQFSNSLVNTKKPKYSYNLLSCGVLVPEIHYGPFATNWWSTPTQKKTAIPYRIGMKVEVELNNVVFSVCVIKQFQADSKPCFCCEVGEESVTCETASAAINSMYKKITNKTGTEYSGTMALGFDEPSIVEELLRDVDFRPFIVNLDNINIFIISIGSEFGTEVGEGFCSSFKSKYKTKSCHFVQFSPTQIAKLTKTSIQKPTSISTPHSIPETTWIMPQLRDPQNHCMFLYKIFFVHKCYILIN